MQGYQGSAIAICNHAYRLLADALQLRTRKHEEHQANVETIDKCANNKCCGSNIVCFRQIQRQRGAMRQGFRIARPIEGGEQYGG